MKNFFNFPKYGENSEKKIGTHAFRIGIIIAVCFIASLFVQGIVSDRISRNEMAVSNIKGLNEFSLTNVVEFAYLDTQTVSNGVTGQAQLAPVTNNSGYDLFSSTDIEIKDIAFKKLGKQNIPVFTGSAVLRGSFDAVGEAEIAGSIKSNGSINLALPAGVDLKTVTVNIDGDEMKSFATTTIARDKITLPASFVKNIKPTSTISLAYSFTGINKISKNYSGVPGVPNNKNVTISTKTNNIRLLNSANSTFSKKDNVVSMDIQNYEYDTGVVFLSGADDITLVDRILKYAILFIVLVFSLTLFIDLKKGLTVNTIQYFLVGISLALFYLLVLALGEEIGYLSAYIIGAVLTAVLNSWYASEIFNSKKAGKVFGIVLLALYALLYMIVQLNSISLLLGTIILYVLLFVFMYASKRLNRA